MNGNSMHPALFTFLLLISIWQLSGCTTTYACGTPNGVGCMSVTEVYEKTNDGTLKETRAIPLDEELDEEEQAEVRQKTAMETSALAKARGSILNTPSGAAIRAEEEVVQLWFNAWRDTNDVLWGPQYAWVVDKRGEWLLNVNRQIGIQRAVGQ